MGGGKGVVDVEEGEVMVGKESSRAGGCVRG